MNLGIEGRTALVCGSSRGLGKACAIALASEGANVVINGRDKETLEKAVAEVRCAATGTVTGVAADVSTAEGRAALLAACPNPDILVTNAGGPEPKYFSDVEPGEWLAGLDQNMIAPILLVRAVLGGMRERKFGRIINITSAMVTTPRPHMPLSAGARAGLTAVMKALSFEVAKDNVTINNLLPERFDTDRQHYMAEQTAIRDNISYDEARRRQLKSIAAGRLGQPSEFGAICVFLCGTSAGFMSGQNMHLDGGSYPGLI